MALETINLFSIENANFCFDVNHLLAFYEIHCKNFAGTATFIDGCSRIMSAVYKSSNGRLSQFLLFCVHPLVRNDESEPRGGRVMRT